MIGLLPRLEEMFQEVFDDDDLAITRETTARDVEEWDSLMHVTLMLAVERGFGVRFSSSEVAMLESVGELVDLIDSKSRSDE